MNTKHTPGPWIRSRDIDNSPDIHILSEDRALIATVSHMIAFNPFTQDSDEMKANARLIKASPTLLEEMQRFLVVLERAELHPEIWEKLTEGTGIATLNAYRKAIADATS